MIVPKLHAWDLTFPEASALQKRLAERVDSASPLPRDWKRIAAADVSYNRGDTTIHAAVVVLDRDGTEPVEVATAEARMTFPYVPGFLSFRELPAVLAAFERIRAEFDIVMADGQGIAHPRRLGLASHLGLWLDRPTVGCAKSPLCGTYETPDRIVGATTPLMLGEDRVGTVLRTKPRANPVWVSPGHRCDFDSAVELVLETARGYRLPLPTRLAHRAVNEARRAADARRAAES